MPVDYKRQAGEAARAGWRKTHPRKKTRGGVTTVRGHPLRMPPRWIAREKRLAGLSRAEIDHLTSLPDWEYRNKHGRVVFDDPKVEDMNRFYEENGPRGVWRGSVHEVGHLESDMEAVRKITSNPNYGRPILKWVV